MICESKMQKAASPLLRKKPYYLILHSCKWKWRSWPLLPTLMLLFLIWDTSEDSSPINTGSPTLISGFIGATNQKWSLDVITALALLWFYKKPNHQIQSGLLPEVNTLTFTASRLRDVDPWSINLIVHVWSCILSLKSYWQSHCSASLKSNTSEWFDSHLLNSIIAYCGINLKRITSK